MKKEIFVFLFLASFFVGGINAQINFNLKLGAGINNSRSYYKSPDDFFPERLHDINSDPAFSYLLGGNINYVLNQKNILAADIAYSCKAFIFNNSVNEKLTVKNYFIVIPIYIKHKLYKKIGANIGFMNNIFVANSYNKEDAVKKYNIGLTMGLYYNIWRKLELSLDYHQDISPYERMIFFGAKQNAYNSGVLLSISYRIFNK